MYPCVLSYIIGYIFLSTLIDDADLAGLCSVSVKWHTLSLHSEYPNTLGACFIVMFHAVRSQIQSGGARFRAHYEALTLWNGRGALEC